MKVIKNIATYLVWMLLSLLIGIVYMRILLGPNDVPKEGLWYLLHVLYTYGLFHVGLIIGSIIAFLFILLDVFYLKKRLKKSFKSVTIRIVILLCISLIVGIIHYILEKVIDVI